MNESDFIRQQLQLERTHLREILHRVRPATRDPAAHPAGRYIDWAGRRLIQQVLAHQTALQHSAAPDPALHEPLAAAGRALRIAHWRRTAHPSDEAILEERRLYAAARGAGAADG